MILDTGASLQLTYSPTRTIPPSYPHIQGPVTCDDHTSATLKNWMSWLTLGMAQLMITESSDNYTSSQALFICGFSYDLLMLTLYVGSPSVRPFEKFWSVVF